MTRWLLYRFIPFYLLLTTGMTGLMLLFSETGLNWLWQQARGHLPEGVQIEKLEGRLLGQIQLHGLSINHPEMNLQVQQAWLHWSPWALWDRKLLITDFSVVGARYEVLGTTQEAPAGPRPDQLPQLPDIQIQQLRLREIEILQQQASTLLIQKADLSGQLRQQQLQLDVHALQTRELGHWQAQLSAEILPQKLTVHALQISSPQLEALQLKLAGQCDWPSLLCTAALDWHALRWPLQDAQFESARGSAQARFGASQTQLNLAAELGGNLLPPSELKLTAESPDGMKNWRFQGDWQQQGEAGDGARLKLEGQFEAASRRIQANLNGQDLNAAWWRADWPSRLDVSSRLQLLLGEQIRITAEQLQINGQLRAQTFALDASGHWANGRDWSLRNFALRWAGNDMHGKLAHRSTWNGQVKLQAPDLGQLDPRLGGKLDATLRVSGTGSLPDMHWQLAGQKLNFESFDLAKIDTQGSFAQEAIKLSLQARTLQGDGLQLQELSLQAAGSPSDTEITLNLKESRGELQLALRSLWQAKQQRLSLGMRQGRLLLGAQAREQQAAWAWKEGQELIWQSGDLLLPSQCWSSQDSSSCFQAQWQDEKLSAQLQLNNYALQRLQSWLPPGSQIDGAVNLVLAIAPSALDQLQSSLSLRNTPITLRTRQGQQDIRVIELLNGELEAQFSGLLGQAHWSFPVAGNGPQQQGLNGELSLGEADQLQARLSLRLDDLAFLSALSPEILESSGKLAGDLRLIGTRQSPQLSGALRLQSGQLDLDRPNLQLQDLQVELLPRPDQSLQVRASARSGDGDLSLQGHWYWQDRAKGFQAQIQGQDFLAVDTAEARVLVSPNLTLQARLPDVRLQGRVLIPQAQIRPRELNQRTAISPDPDQRIAGQDKPIEQALRIDSEVQLILGDGVQFEGLGLTAALGGKLSTRMKPGQVATGLGDLRLLNGRYKAYGQDLRIERGRLIFSGGPLTEPGLDIKAFRQATADIRAGVIVRGPLSKPQLSLYSDPNMRETDQLSYLVLGRAAEAENENDQAALNNAALALGLKGGDFLAKRFKRSLGLDEVTIGAQPGEDSSQASLVLGKFLSPDIYVSYGIGLFQPVYTFKLRYRLSSKWSLQTESGVESGGDVFYTIERGD